ncbi:MAG: RDD family protein [Anaerolineaceae bacterium]|nr:RDD family protein [Anaerolineaceae bacterium]
MGYEYSEITSYELADPGKRLGALIVDTMILGAVTGILFAGASWTGGALGLLGTIVYQWAFLVHNNGQTPGKMLTNLRVIKADGSEITDTDAILRAVGYHINTWILMIGWLWALVDSKHQGFHDKIARTYVVTVPTEKWKAEKRKVVV